MSTDDTKAFIRRYFDAISGKDKPTDVLNEYIADESLVHHIMLVEAGFPRYELIPEDIIAEGDKVVVRALLRATQNGEFQGIPPTGKQVTLPAIVIYQIDNGKIVHHWLSFDSLSVLQQLGVMPTPEQAAA